MYLWPLQFPFRLMCFPSCFLLLEWKMGTFVYHVTLIALQTIVCILLAVRTLISTFAFLFYLRQLPLSLSFVYISIYSTGYLPIWNGLFSEVCYHRNALTIWLFDILVQRRQPLKAWKLNFYVPCCMLPISNRHRERSTRFQINGAHNLSITYCLQSMWKRTTSLGCAVPHWWSNQIVKSEWEH